MTTVAFRVDGDRRIGLGHAMRCMALATALQQRGARALFVTRSLAEALQRKIASRGFPVRYIGPCSDEEEDARLTLTAVGEDCANAWICVDHYDLGACWERVAASRGARVAAIDDFGVRAHDCDLVIDHNIGVTRSDYVHRTSARARLCLGPAYALLRPEFALRSVRRLRKRVERVHVAFGGADPMRDTEKALAALGRAHLRSVPADVVLGAANPRAFSIQRFVAGLPSVRLHIDVENMVDLLTQADLAVGAAGVSALERCALGLPSLVVIAAANQRRIAQALASQGAAIVLGESATVSSDDIADAIGSLLEKPAPLASYSQAAAALCDGAGAARVAEVMLSW